MNWLCAIGIHDWHYREAAHSVTTIDRKGLLVEIKRNHDVKDSTRVCRRCDKRQALVRGGMSEPAFWQTFPKTEDQPERLNP